VLAPWMDDPDNIARLQEEKYCQIYRPIAKKCIGLVSGNHEDSIKKHSHINVHKNICDALSVPNLGSSAFIRLRFERENTGHRQNFDIYVAHGAGWAITKGAKLNRLERVMDNFEADIYCFPSDEKVWLGNGNRLNIQDIEVGQKIMSYNGSLCNVNQVFSRDYDGNIVKLQVSGLYQEIRMTPEHPILVRGSKHQWQKASSIKVGDYVAVTVPKVVIVSPKKRYCYDKDKSKLARLIGLFLAEGHTTNDKRSYQVVWAFNDKEEHLALEVQTLLKDVWGKGGTISYSGTSVTIRVVSKEINNFFTKVCGRLSAHKALTEEVLCWDKELLKIILLAWLEGDGHKGDTTQYGYTISEKLAHQMFNIALKLNWHPSLNKRPSRNIHKESYTLSFSTQFLGEGRINHKKTKPYNRSRSWDWYRVKSVNIEHYKGKVYNLETTRTHTYVVGGIAVHNCFGHLHEILTSTKPYLALNNELKIKQRKKIGAITGCFFRTYMQNVGASYGEKRNLPPVTIGAVVFSINPEKDEIDVHQV